MSETSPSSDGPLKGFLLVFAGVALFATVEVAVKDAKMEGSLLPPFWFVALRFFISGTVLVGISLFNTKTVQKIPEGMDIIKMALLGIVAAPLAIGLFHKALDYEALKASAGAAIFSVNPIFVAVLAPFFLGEKARVKEWSGLILGFSGAFLMSYSKGGGGDGLFAGGAIMASSAFFFALNVVLAKPLIKKYGGIMFTGWAFTFGGLISIGCALAVEGTLPGTLFRFSKGTADILWVIGAGTALAYYCYLAGLAKVNVTKGSYLFFAKPFLALVFSFVYLREQLFSASEWVGFALIVSGLALTLKPGKKTEITGKTPDMPDPAAE